MENITITLDEELVRRARNEAARDGVSLSKFVTGLVEARVGRTGNPKEVPEALRNFRGFPGLSENMPSRTEIYDETLLSGHEYSNLPDRPAKREKANAGV